MPRSLPWRSMFRSGFTCIVTLLTVVAAAGLHAEDKPAIKSAADQPVDEKTEWQSLFDGQTLNNWDATDYGGQGSVLVKDGLLVLEAGEPLTGVTWKGKALPTNNYEIRLEAQKVEGSDFFLALTFPVQEKHVSLVLGGWGGGVTGISSINGFDASENETTDYYGFDRKKWYKVRVRVTDDAIQAWLDDERICNVETAGKRFDTRIEVDLNKPLGMATFQTVAAYRNIEYRDLTAEQSPAATEAQPRKGE